ncbi:carboxypeptidase-like regulatory domain-containing protein [Maribacter sp.]|nr:carboxypeptidase-like regulatory domain-containing protein [Maribacter sp.]
MNRFYIVLLLGLGCLCHQANAQKVTLEGQVNDTLNNPLELANVIAINKNTQAMASYGITDATGAFRLVLKKDSLYTLRVSYLGFETWEADFLAEMSETKNVSLQPSLNQLDGVEVVEDFPVSISGDTITYKADAFTSGKEKKLENILEQLPGFQIDDEGQIKVQGKEISKVLVEGKEFFDGDSKMATKNIPANAVDKVQVLRNFNEIGPLSGVNDSGALALNIKLKEGKKNMWFGDVSAGGGPQERYTLHPNFFYYSPKVSVNMIGDLNNIGEQAFTLQDYFRFNGGLSSLMGRSGSSLDLSRDDTGLSLMQDNRAKNVISSLAAINIGFNPNKKISFSSFAILSSVATDLESISNRTYIREGGNNEETLASNVLQKNTAGLLKFSSTYTPNSKWYVKYDGFLKGSKIEDQNQLNSNFSGITNAIGSLNTRRPFSVKQTLSAFYSKDDNNVFSLETNLLYKRQRPDYDLLSGQQPFQSIIPLVGDGPFNLFQQKEVFTNSFDSEFNYYRVLNKTNHLSFKAGINRSGQKLTASLTERFPDAPEQAFSDPSFNGTVRFDFTDVYLGLGYRVKLGKLTLDPGVSFHMYAIENRRLNQENNFNKTLLLPKLRAKYVMNTSQSLQFGYGIQASFPDIQNLAQVIQLSGYNSLFEGNPNLRNAWYHDLSLNYLNFSMFNFTTINGGAQYQKRYESIGNAVDFIGVDRISRPINIEAPNETFSIFGTYERRFPYWKGKLETRWSYNKFNNQTDGLANFNRSFTQNYKLALETRFKEAPNVEVGFKKVWNDYASATTESRFVTNSPFGSFEAYFLKGFTFTADYQYNQYKTTTNTNSFYDFLNAALFYLKEDSSWEFKLSVTNLLDNRLIRRDSFSENLIGTQAYSVQPRYFMLGITYNL